MKDPFVLEIGFEELPARHCQAILTQLPEKKIEELGAKNNLSLEGLCIYMTPRRLAITAKKLEQAQPIKEITGPLYDIAFTNGKPSETGKKFAASHGIEPGKLEKKSVNGKDFAMVSKDLSKEFTGNIQSFMDGIISSISVDRPMRWDSTGMKFSRPIRWILCLHGKHSIPLIMGNVVSEKKTYGPRFMDSPSIQVNHAEHYEDELAKHNVIVDHRKRKHLVSKVLEKIEKNDGLITDDPQEDLLTETTFLTEYPQPIICTFYKKLLDLPSDVISTVLVKHQKYFPLLRKESGEMTNTFLVIANYDKDSDLIRQGNEKVVNARLRDGVFFFEQDLKTKLSEFAKLTKNITFQEKLGSMADKMERIEMIATMIAPEVSENVPTDKVTQAAQLAKADLATNMVTEFSSLEGIMGHVYAQEEGLDKEIARSLSEYYHPRYSEDRLPNDDLGTILALADRIDTVYGLFIIDLKPKGSSDPYGLRRMSIGIVRILWEKELSLSLDKLIVAAENAHASKASKEELLTFLLARLEQYLKDTYQKKTKLDTPLIKAVVNNASTRLDTKKAILAQVEQDSKSKDFTLLTELAKRIYNIAVKEKSRKEASLSEKQMNESENHFYSIITGLEKKDTLSLADLYTLIEPGTKFFDENMVMSEDPDERATRLEILWRAYEQISRVLEPENLLS
jgi:glycyl-tRNA synthetase beta chain